MFVIVVASDQFSAKIVSELITSAGHQPFWVNTADDLLQVLSFAKVDSVVIDLDSSPEGAFTVIKLHGFATLEDGLPLLIGMTNWPTPSLQTQCREAAIDIVLEKPVEPSRLHQVLTDSHGTTVLRAAS